MNNLFTLGYEGIKIQENSFIPENDIILISKGKIKIFENALNDYNNKMTKKRIFKLGRLELWIVKKEA